jgi:hypothetical protein
VRAEIPAPQFRVQNHHVKQSELLMRPERARKDRSLRGKTDLFSGSVADLGQLFEQGERSNNSVAAHAAAKNKPTAEEIVRCLITPVAKEKFRSAGFDVP